VSRGSIEASLRDGSVWIEKDDPERFGTREPGSFCGDIDVRADDEIQVIRILSRSATDGEIRRYVIARDELRLALPCPTGTWSEIDHAVARRLGVLLMPYAIRPSGRIVPYNGTPASTMVARYEEREDPLQRGGRDDGPLFGDRS
jgi:hypothetical protein